MSERELIVVGGGAAGLGAARAARWLGRPVTLVSDGPIGGDCTHTGCVPSKTLLAQGRSGVDLATALEATAAVVERIAATEDAEVLAREGIEVLEGRGRFVGPRDLDVDGTRLRAERFVVATGSAAARPPIAGLGEVRHRTNADIWLLPSTTRRLGIIGAGPIGCELAQAFADLGVAVTVFEARARVLPAEEPETSDVIARSLAARSVDVRAGAAVGSVVGVAAVADGIELTPAAGPSVVVDEVLVAAGRRPRTEGLGLERAGVELTSTGHVRTDTRLRTNVRHIAAAGDVTGRLPFTHAADEMGRLAVGHLFGEGLRWRFDARAVPWVTFTDPEVARVGWTESEAARRGGRVAYLPLSEVDRAVTEGRTDGFVKIVAGPRRITRNLFGGRVLGATIVAPRAGEMIHELALAMRAGVFTGRLGQTLHAYPTWSSGVQKAVAQFFYELEGRSARPARRRV